MDYLNWNKRQKIKAAINDLCPTSHWRSVCALSLNMKQAYRDRDGYSKYVCEIEAKKEFGKYCFELNRKIYKSAHRHHGKRLKIIPFIEKKEFGRWHYHLAIEPPEHLQAVEFCETAMALWENTPLGYGHGMYKTNRDQGWIEYCAKHASKSFLETYSDCLDIDSLHNPVASA